MLLLTRADVRRLVPMPDAVELMKQAFAELSAGRTASPLRTVIPVREHHGDALFMPGHVPAMNALGLKIVSVFRDNPARGLPVINALVAAIDPETGVPMAVMDGTYLTALRTGAVSGAATDLLARPDSRVLASIGSGAQGVTQVAAVCAVRPIERVIQVYRSEDRRAKFAEALATDWPDLVPLVEYATDANAAVAQADVVCAATSARTPVFAAEAVRDGAHVNAVGAYTHEMQELPPSLVARATVVVDAIDAVLAEAGDLVIPMNEGLFGRDHISRELGDVAAGRAPGRTSASEITLFKSVGNSVQDVVVARRAYDRARAEGVGVDFQFG
ncbi:MAG: ornithine cyclodeaminase family protein [Chloroflexota bacterium]